MKDCDNRIEKNFQAYQTRKLRCKEAADRKKNTNSHEEIAKKPTFNNACMQHGLRDTAFHGCRATKIALVSYYSPSTHSPLSPSTPYTTTPSHHISTLINAFPETTTSSIEGEDGNPIHLPFQLPAWRRLNERTKPYFYQLALSELESTSNNHYRLVPFVFNESTSLTQAIDKQKLKRLDYLRDRLQKALNEALSRPKDNQVAFWFAFETARRSQPHIQGALLIRLDEVKKARDAFYKLNGEMSVREKQGALRFLFGKRNQLFKKRGCLCTDLNWADYNLKERATTRREYAMWWQSVSRLLRLPETITSGLDRNLNSNDIKSFISCSYFGKMFVDRAVDKKFGEVYVAMNCSLYSTKCWTSDKKRLGDKVHSAATQAVYGAG